MTPATQTTIGAVKPGWGHFIYGDGTLGATTIDVRAFGAVGDGVTDDTAACQAALDASANANGARVMFPANKAYLVSASLLPHNGTVVQIDGTILLKAGLTCSVIANLNAPTGIVIEGCGILDGGYAGNSPGNVLAVQNPPRTSAGGITFNVASNIRVRDITIQNTANYAWAFGASSNIMVQNVTAKNQGNTSGFTSLSLPVANTSPQQYALTPSTDCWAQNITVVRTRGDYGFGFYGYSKRCGITGSNISACGSPAVCVLGDSGQMGVGSDVVIADNILHDNPGGAISLQGNGVPVGKFHTNIVVTGNRGFNNCGGGGITTGVAGVYITNGKNVLIANNHFGPDGSDGYDTVGIAVTTANSVNVTVQGNLIVDQGTKAKVVNGNAGIFCDGNDINTVIHGNTILDTRAAPVCDYAIRAAAPAGAGCVIEGNTVHGIATPYNIDPALVQVRQSGLRWNLDGVLSVSDINLVGSGGMAGAWTSASAPVTSSGGNLGSGATAMVRYKKFGRSVYLNAKVLIPHVGTASGNIQVTLPFASAISSGFAGREGTTTGRGLNGITVDGGTFFISRTAMVTSPPP